MFAGVGTRPGRARPPKGPITCSSRAALKAVDTDRWTEALLTEAGRQGMFLWMAGNYSSQVTADTLEGIYVKATAIASSAGAWVRIYAAALKPEWFGADPTGAVDATAAFTAAMAMAVLGAAKGGTIAITGKYLIDNNLTIPARVTIEGNFLFGAQSDGDYNAFGSQLALNPAKTITPGSSSALRGVVVLNKNMPANVRQDTQSNYTTDAAAVIAIFSGTAITTAGVDATLEQCFIGGFAKAFDGNACHRIRMRQVAIDCTDGVDIDATLDVSRISDVHCFPYLTAGRANNTTEMAYWERSGNAFNFTGINDGLTVENCFSFCWNQGFVDNAGASVKMIACWTDYFSALNRTGSIGFHILNGARATELVACHASSMGRGLVANTADTIVAVGWESWLCLDAHIDHIDGHLLMSSPSLDLYGASSGVIGYRSATGADSARLVAPKFKGFTTPLSIHANAKLNTELVAPNFDGGSGAVVAQMRQISMLPTDANEGGQIDFQSGTSYSGDISIDRFQNDIRIFCNDATNRKLIVNNFGAGKIDVDFSDGDVATSGYLRSTGSGVGYATGAGGTVTQATSKSTGVTLNKATGQIALNNAALAANTTVSFTLTDSAIAAGDILVLNHISGGTAGSYALNAQCAAGSASINVRNITAGSLSEAIVISFAVIKAVTA